MQEHGLVAIVKRNCPTCVLVAPVLQEILQHSDLKIYTQDDPSFPEGIEGVADDTSLDVSYRLDVEIVPTLVRFENGVEVDRTYGWNRLYSNSRLKSFGIGLTVLRKLAKQIGRDRHLSMKLWDSEVYDARVISMLIDDPKQITREQAEQQVEQMGEGQLMHVFSSFGASLAKVPYSVELADDWISTKDEKRKQCGYVLLYEISKSKKKTAPDDNFFLGHINLIDKTYKKQSIDVLMSMAGALLGIGKRNKKLNKAALKVAKAIGPIDFSADGSCDPFDVVPCAD